MRHATATPAATSFSSCLRHLYLGSQVRHGRTRVATFHARCRPVWDLKLFKSQMSSDCTKATTLSRGSSLNGASRSRARTSAHCPGQPRRVQRNNKRQLGVCDAACHKRVEQRTGGGVRDVVHAAAHAAAAFGHVAGPVKLVVLAGHPVVEREDPQSSLRLTAGTVTYEGRVSNALQVQCRCMLRARQTRGGDANANDGGALHKHPLEAQRAQQPQPRGSAASAGDRCAAVARKADGKRPRCRASPRYLDSRRCEPAPPHTKAHSAPPTQRPKQRSLSKQCYSCFVRV